MSMAGEPGSKETQMEGKPMTLAGFLAAVRRTLAIRPQMPDRPQPGWERRTLHFPNGELLEFECPIDPGVLRGMTRADDDRSVSSMRSSRSGTVSPPAPPVRAPLEAGRIGLGRRRGRCELLDEFLERRARR